MSHSSPIDSNLSFYVINDRRYAKDSDQLIQHYGLTLPKAISIYNSYEPSKNSAIGVKLGEVETDLVQRLDGESTLVTDYQQMEEWMHNPYLCISAVSLLIANLDIHRQMDAHCVTRPFEERLHVMRMKDTEDLQPCFMKSRETMQRLGVEPTMDLYDLIYSEPMKPGEAMVDACKRYQVNKPTKYTGFAPTVSDVLVYQTRKGCHAIFIDCFGFDLVDKFVRPPGWHGTDAFIRDPLYSWKGDAR